MERQECSGIAGKSRQAIGTGRPPTVPTREWLLVPDLSSSLPGPHGYGYSTDVVVMNGARSFPIDLFYPALPCAAPLLPIPFASLMSPPVHQAWKGPFDPSGGPYPIITFAHGLMQPDMEYQSYFRHWATHGYFVLILPSPLLLPILFPLFQVVAPRADYIGNPNANLFASDCRAAVSWIKQQNNNASSPFYGAVRLLFTSPHPAF